MENLPTVKNPGEIFMDAGSFEHIQRVGNMFAKSSLVPDHFRNNVGNCVIALNYAFRVGIDPFMVMQKMYVIHGKPAVEAQLQIALLNNSNRFSPIKYRESGDGDKRSCQAYAIEKESGEEVTGPVVSIEMAKAEGWYGKKGSKWVTMPELMLRYRAAAFFIRVNAPETTLGLHTVEELRDIDAIDITDRVTTIGGPVDEDNLKKRLEAAVSAGKTDDDEDAGPWHPDAWKNLRAAGFADYVNKHIDALTVSDDETVQAVKSKWARVYPDDRFPLDPEEKKDGPGMTEQASKTPGIYGTDLADGFFQKCPDGGLKEAAQDIWDHPTKYRDNIGSDGSEQAYYRFLKFLYVVKEDGSECRINEFIEPEATTVKEDPTKVTCPNTEEDVDTKYCDSQCQYRNGCPAFI